MLRRRGQKSLYEAISSAKQGPVSGKEPAQPLHPQQKPPEKKPASKQTAQAALSTLNEKAGWPKMPRAATFIGGRLELSLSLGTCIVSGLVVILMLIIFFRLGQIYGKTDTSKPVAAASNQLPPEGFGVHTENANPVIPQSTFSGTAALRHRLKQDCY